MSTRIVIVLVSICSQVLELQILTETCLTHLWDSLKTNIDKGHYTGMILIDFQKAFDTVNYNI